MTGKSRAESTGSLQDVRIKIKNCSKVICHVHRPKGPKGGQGRLLLYARQSSI